MSLTVSLKEMQEKQFLPTAGECVLSSTYLSVLFKNPVVTKPQQHMAHSRILRLQQQHFSYKLSVFVRNVTGDFSIAGWQEEKSNKKMVGWWQCSV